MRERGISPVVATVMLISITVAAAVPLAMYFSGMYPPTGRVRRTDVEVYAGLVNENTVRFHILHTGGQTVSDPLDPTDPVRGVARAVEVPVENEIYSWTFENPERFRQSDWARAEVQLHGANLLVGSKVWVNIWSARAGAIFPLAEVRVDDVDKIPG